MIEVRLPDLRIGFAYGATINFPAGFLAPEERCRAKIRRYPGQEIADAVFADDRVGDSILLDLTVEQTAVLEPGTYLSELIIYDSLDPLVDEIAIADNTFRIEAGYSPSA